MPKNQPIKLATPLFAPDNVVLVYIDSTGKEYEQPLSDLQDAGTLVDPDTGDDMSLIGARMIVRPIAPQLPNQNARLFNIWVEGYAATGESGKAQQVNEDPILAENFQAAVALYVETLSAKDRAYWEQNARGQWSQWGCDAYPDEDSARKAFG